MATTTITLRCTREIFLNFKKIKLICHDKYKKKIIIIIIVILCRIPITN